MFPATSVQHLISATEVREAGDLALDVRPSGVAVLVTPEPAAHAYDTSLQAWVPLITPWQLAYPSTERRAAKEQIKGPLSDIEARVQEIWAQDRTRAQSFPASDVAQLDWWSETREINYWEARLRGAELLESPAEYRQAVTKLAQLFAREGFAARAEELVKDLTGPIFRCASLGGWHVIMIANLRVAGQKTHRSDPMLVLCRRWNSSRMFSVLTVGPGVQTV